MSYDGVTEREFSTLEDYCEPRELVTTREIAEHFGVSQATIVRWQKQDNLWVIVDPEKDGENVWDEVFVEKVLKKR